VVKIVCNGYFDGTNHIVTLAVSPIQYYPLSNKIDVINEVEYTIKQKATTKRMKFLSVSPSIKKFTMMP